MNQDYSTGIANISGNGNMIVSYGQSILTDNDIMEASDAIYIEQKKYKDSLFFKWLKI